MKPIWQQLNEHEWTPVQHERVRARLVRHMQMVSGAETPAVSRWFLFPRWSPAVAAVVLVALLGGSGVAMAASSGSQPYEVLYPVRMFAQTMRTKLTRDPVKKVELVLKYSEDRLSEMRTLATMQAAAEGRGRAEVVVSGEKRIKAFRRNGQAMKRFAELAEKHVERLRETQENGETEELSAQLDAVLDASLGILLSVETNAPVDEPVRAVAAKAKQEISPVESNVERTINEHKVKAFERFTKMPTVLKEEDDDKEDDDKDEKKIDEEGEDADDEKKSRVAEQATSGEGGVFATARIEAARRSIERAAELLEDAAEKYGDDAIIEMKRAFGNARAHLEKAEMLFKDGDYQAAFTEAGEATRIAAHLKVYLPIIEKRAKVLMDDQGQLKLYILPKYLDDQKPAVTTTVSTDTVVTGTVR